MLNVTCLQYKPTCVITVTTCLRFCGTSGSFYSTVSCSSAFVSALVVKMSLWALPIKTLSREDCYLHRDCQIQEPKLLGLKTRNRIQGIILGWSRNSPTPTYYFCSICLPPPSSSFFYITHQQSCPIGQHRRNTHSLYSCVLIAATVRSICDMYCRGDLTRCRYILYNIHFTLHLQNVTHRGYL